MKTTLHSALRTLTSLIGTALLASASASAQTVTWSDFGPGKLNYNPAKPAHQPATVVVPGSPNKLYAIWAEANGTGLIYQIRVSVYNSSVVNDWDFVDRNVNGTARAADQGINKVTTKAGSLPVLEVVNGNLFAAWIEAGQVRVATYNANDANSNWTFIDGNAVAKGINFDSKKAAHDPALIAFNGKLYASWHEAGKSVSQIRVKAFDLATKTWSLVDGGGATGINFNTARNASYVRLAVLSGATSKLYATWHESNGSRNIVRVKVYSGSGNTWSSADGGGLNYSTAANGTFPYLFAFNSKMYLFWEESYQIRVRSYNGSNDAAPAWNLVDGGGTVGINVDPAHWAYYVTAAEVSGKLFVGFNELNAANIEQLRVKAYNGNDSAPAWSSEDGGGTSGLASGSSRPQLLNLDSQLNIIVDFGTWPDYGIHALLRTETP